MVRFYTFIVCLVLLLGMSRCVPAWADQPSASHGYDAATHYDDSLDSDCQSTPPGCAYVAQEHKTDCAHSLTPGAPGLTFCILRVLTPLANA